MAPAAYGGGKERDCARFGLTRAVHKERPSLEATAESAAFVARALL